MTMISVYLLYRNQFHAGHLINLIFLFSLFLLYHMNCVHGVVFFLKPTNVITSICNQEKRKAVIDSDQTGGFLMSAQAINFQLNIFIYNATMNMNQLNSKNHSLDLLASTLHMRNGDIPAVALYIITYIRLTDMLTFGLTLTAPIFPKI